MKTRVKLPAFLLWTLLCLIISLLLTVSARAGQVLNDALVTRPFNHHIWQDVITRFVNQKGAPDLVRLKAEPARLNQYLQQLAAVSPESQPEYFPRADDALVYWINAYNAIALRQWIDHYPEQNLERLPDFETVARYPLGGKPYSLQDIRRKVTGGYHRHPKVLFALSNFTTRAPALSPRIYQAATLSEQLDEAARQTLGDEQLIRFQRGACLGIVLSPFFQAYTPALLATEAWKTEDQDQLPARFEAGPATARTWRDILLPVMPPELFADLNRPCAHEVSFSNAHGWLRSAGR